MATRLCAGHGGLDHEGILLCALDEEAQVAVGAPPIDMRQLILTTLAADRALTFARPFAIFTTLLVLTCGQMQKRSGLRSP